MQNKQEVLFDEYMDLIEFGLVKYNDGFGVIDHQGANLGNISEDRFETADQIFDRMDIYVNDYIVHSIESCLDYIEVDYNYEYWDDLFEFKDKLPYYDWEFDILDMICNHAKEINLENCCYQKEEDI